MAEPKQGQATILANMIGSEARVELFHDADDDAWARVELRPEVFEHWRVESEKFREWITYYSHKEHGIVPGPDNVKTACRALAARAKYEGELHPVHVRVAHKDGSTFVDLADKERHVVEIRPKGWRVIDGEPPVRFSRAHGMRSLPLPKLGTEKFAPLLQPFVNVARPDLVVTTTLATNRLSGIGPFPIEGVHGEHGTGKTVGTRVRRDLTDPNKADVRALPEEERDLVISAQNSYVLAFGNVSELPRVMSDAFCRMSTGAGFSRRMLYTDADEIILSMMRPIIIEGIPEVESAPDLADRTVTVVLEPLKSYLSEVEFWKRFEAAHPELLGSAFSAVAVGLGRLERGSGESEFRMADFAAWAEAVEPAVGKGFIRAYKEQREESAAAALEDCIFYDQLIDALNLEGGTIEDTPAKVLGIIEGRLPEGKQKPKEWPGSPAAFGEQLRRISPALRSEGIGIEGRKSHGRRVIAIWYLKDDPDPPRFRREDEEEGDRADW